MSVSFPVIASLVSSFVAVISVGLAVATFRRTRRYEKNRHIEAVRLIPHDVDGEITENHHPTIRVYNDGDYTVLVASVGLLLGTLQVIDRKHPTMWSMHHEFNSYAVRPGEFIEVDQPDLPSGIGQIGYCAFVTDSAGRQWLLSDSFYRPAIDTPVYARRIPRRYLWFERQRWFAAFDDFWVCMALAIQCKHPNWYPVLPLLITKLWDWREGPVDGKLMPFGAPRGWLYYRGQDLGVPQVGQPTYSWKRQG